LGRRTLVDERLLFVDRFGTYSDDDDDNDVADDDNEANSQFKSAIGACFVSSFVERIH
jgi:hypothetical protein